MRHSRTHSEPLATLVLAGALVAAAAGCQSARVEQPLTASLAADAPDTRVEFWHQLSSQPITSNDDAFHALLLYFNGNDPAAEFAERVERLKQRGMLPRDFAAPADEAVDRGTLAFAISKALEIKGGATMRLFGI